MSEQKWVRSSLRHVSQHLVDLGHGVSPPTVSRLLRQLGYSLRVNVKKQEASATHPDRNTQFEQIQDQKQRFEAANCPIISVDTKKKELIGNFKNAGQAWKEEPEAVNAHDFPQDAVSKAVPYGIYDVLRNCGTVYVGSSADTSAFAVAALARWWECKSQHETGLICIFILVALYAYRASLQADGAGNVFTRIIMPEWPV